MKPTAMLIAEDNPGDLLLLTDALEQFGWDHHLSLARDGAEALDLLFRKSPDGPLPDLVLLDLNLPIVSGREVLAAIRKDPNLAQLPVFILSGSEWERGELLALGISEAFYLVKPMTFSGYLKIVARIQSMYLSLA